MIWLYIAQFPVLVALIAWLFAKHCQRQRARIAEYETWLAREVGRLDPDPEVAVLAPRVRQVRGDYIAELKSHPRPATHRDALVASARQQIRQRAYFHEEEEIQDPALEPAGVQPTD